MSKYEEANLILKLYELRREETMRAARDWYFREFQPETVADFGKAIMSEHSGHLRMVMSYWEMAAAMVNHGAISLDFFTDTNGEHLTVFGILEPILGELRAQFGPQMLSSLEKVVDATPKGRERTAMLRERMKGVRERLAAAKKPA